MRIVVRVAGLLLLAAAGKSGTASAQDSTAKITYKGVTITPIGFFAAEGLARQRSQYGDIGSNFNSIPFSSATNGRLTEIRGSARQSRLGVAVDSKVGDVKLGGYFEGDFLSAGVTSNSNESNSYTFRVRQFWGQAAFANGWTVSFGQSWSLMTTNKNGVALRGEAIPLTIDAQYAAGFNWERQFGVRLTKKIDDHLTWAIAVEESQQLFAARSAPAQLIIGATGGPLLNSTANYSNDYLPDVSTKLAWDPGYGHYELKLLGRAFRDRIVDTLGTFGGSRNTRAFGGGIGLGMILPVKVDNRNVADIGLSVLWGSGIGRYGTSTLPDITVTDSGQVVGIPATQFMLSIETHPTTNLDVYGYVGAEYNERAAYLSTAGKGVGYGSTLNDLSFCDREVPPTGPYAPGTSTCNADTRSLSQANIGFWYRFYRGSAGTMQWGMQYSYTSRGIWSGKNGQEPQAVDNMLFTAVRYYLP